MPKQLKMPPDYLPITEEFLSLASSIGVSFIQIPPEQFEAVCAWYAVDSVDTEEIIICGVSITRDTFSMYDFDNEEFICGFYPVRTIH